MSATFDTSDIDQLADKLFATAERLALMTSDEGAKQEIKNNMKLVTQDAASRVNSITGNLAGAIETRITVRVDAPTKVECGISYKRRINARHAHLVEGGHGGPHSAPPHPFWEPAVQAHGEEAVNALEDMMKNKLDEAMQLI